MQVLASVGVISPEAPALAFAAVAVGSFLFGIGIVLSGGCATGTYYRSGEGLIGSWIALGLYAFTSAAMKYGVGADFTASLRDQTIDATTIHGTFGLSAWVPVICFPRPGGLPAGAAEQEKPHAARHVSAPKDGNRSCAVRKEVDAKHNRDNRWCARGTGLPAVSGHGPQLGIGYHHSIGQYRPVLDHGPDGPDRLGCGLRAGNHPGSYIAAKGSGEFRLRAPDASTAVRAVFGGTIMGVGASLAGGCTIGNALVQTALFSWQGWIAFAFTFLGVLGFAAKFFITRGRGAQAGADSAGASPALVQVQ